MFKMFAHVYSSLNGGTESPNAGGISGTRTERWRRSDLPEGEILPLMPCEALVEESFA